MPDPIQSSTNVCDYSAVEGATSEENTGQVSLRSAHAADAQSVAPATPNAPPAPPPPAVGQLVARFVKPTAVHPPVEPSLVHALGHCKLEAAGFAISTASAIGGAPETFGLSMAVLGARMLVSGLSLNKCLAKDEAQQVEDGNRANQIADCKALGSDTAVTALDGSVLCALPQ